MKTLTKLPALLVLMLLLAGAAVACSDDSDDSDDVSPEEAYCAAGDALAVSFESLIDLDLIAEGTNGLQDAIDGVKSDVSEFVDAAEKVTEDEAKALETAFDDLQSAVDALGDEDLSLDNGAAVIAAVEAVAAASRTAFTTLTETC